MNLLVALIVIGLVLGGSIVLGVLADRPVPPKPAPELTPDLDAHWSQTADPFKPEEGKS